MPSADSRNSRAIGDLAEDRAADYLVSLGYEILARNYCVRGGEIDIVARDGSTVVFVEVKYRSGKHERYGTAIESVTPRKIERMTRAIEQWMADYQTEDVRVDVAIVKDGVDPTILKGIEIG